MKHMVIDLNDTNEPTMFSKSIPGNLFFDILFGELDVEFSPIANSSMHLKLLPFT